ncbi:winged helix-turn-helix domain-containing protein [Erwinia billingiae]|uniref:winged helix-turn-helix domain-containing protein n=1 Tax=Erwinia billingiae TaxID=182337 RepID=UPI000CFF5B3B|nr:winged helix-turn-helix domain-containing protein [Erwinia billingiae]PRB60260.1 DNA-binding response regulator [Erwinia billingiae]
MKILIIEDEENSAVYLKNGLNAEGYIVDSAANVIDGLLLAKKSAYYLILLDVTLLDIMLPDINHWTLMVHLLLYLKTPVILLTARGAQEHLLRGLGLSADQYLAKPFLYAELLSRIHNINCHYQPVFESVLSLADLVINNEKFHCERAGQHIALTKKEFSLLVCFLQYPGYVLSRKFLASRVWDMNFDSDSNVVDVAVRRLRKKIDEPFRVQLIHTVHGVGYRCEEEP